jgi:hypothetical protein
MPPGRSQEQGVARQPAQSRECIARRGLRQPEVFGDPRHAALGEQLVEDYQQIETDVLHIHATTIHQIYEMYSPDSIG